MNKGDSTVIGFGPIEHDIPPVDWSTLREAGESDARQTSDLVDNLEQLFVWTGMSEWDWGTVAAVVVIFGAIAIVISMSTGGR